MLSCRRCPRTSFKLSFLAIRGKVQRRHHVRRHENRTFPFQDGSNCRSTLRNHMYRHLFVSSRSHLRRAMGRTYAWRAVARAPSDVGQSPGSCLACTPASFRRDHLVPCRSGLREPASSCSKLVLGCGWVLRAWERRQCSHPKSPGEGNLASECFVYALLEHRGRPHVSRRIFAVRRAPHSAAVKLRVAGAGPGDRPPLVTGCFVALCLDRLQWRRRQCEIKISPHSSKDR